MNFVIGNIEFQIDNIGQLNLQIRPTLILKKSGLNISVHFPNLIYDFLSELLISALDL